MARCAWALVASFAVGGCAADAGHPPLARIVVAPEAIIENDDFQTAVTLDATGSADPIDDPAAALPLTYAWELLDDLARYDRGGASSARPVVRFRGDRPATIVLIVTDGDGQSTTATAHLQLTVR